MKGFSDYVYYTINSSKTYEFWHMIEKNFDFDKLYGKVVRYYRDKKNYPKDKANQIAQKVVQRELKSRTCQNTGCGHMLYDHLRNYESCLINKCSCTKFVKSRA